MVPARDHVGDASEAPHEFKPGRNVRQPHRCKSMTSRSERETLLVRYVPS